MRPKNKLFWRYGLFFLTLAGCAAPEKKSTSLVVSRDNNRKAAYLPTREYRTAITQQPTAIAIQNSTATATATVSATILPPSMPANTESFISVNGPVFHYGDKVNIEVFAPQAQRVDLTINIEDPPVIPLSFDGETKSWKLSFVLPQKKETAIEEGRYVLIAKLYYRSGVPVKIFKKVWFYEKSK